MFGLSFVWACSFAESSALLRWMTLPGCAYSYTEPAINAVLVLQPRGFRSALAVDPRGCVRGQDGAASLVYPARARTRGCCRVFPAAQAGAFWPEDKCPR